MTQQIADLAMYLAGRQDPLLQVWRNSIKHDPTMTSGSALPRSQLNDHIPAILDAFRERLVASEAANNDVSGNYMDDAAAHGLQRWQQGYDLREVIREWGQLQLCVIDELDRFAASRSIGDTSAMRFARRLWATICTEGATESANQYFRLQQIEAEGQVRDLESALADLRGMEKQRAQLWHEAAHDLRGNVGIVANTTAGLAHESLPSEVRDRLLSILGRNVGSLQSLLEDLMSLARLQAGREQVVIKTFDAALLVREVSDRLRPLAEERGLFISVTGPSSLVVDGDAVKVQRIAQNLLLNACKYTNQGGVAVSYGDSRNHDVARWMLCIEDTGPGFAAGPGAPLAGAIETATEESRAVDAAAKNAAEERESDQSPRAAALPAHQEHGEGIGLSIVKRLCELLNATIELDSVPQRGTTVRVLLPRRYTSG